jgi:hypothetical protein
MQVAYPRGKNQADMYGHVRCTSLTLEREERLKIIKENKIVHSDFIYVVRVCFLLLSLCFPAM